MARLKDHELFEDEPRGRRSPTQKAKERSHYRPIRIHARGIGHRDPQAMIAIKSYAKSMQSVRNTLAYISREGHLDLEINDGEMISGESEQDDLLEDWEVGFDDRKNARHTMHMIISGPQGTDAQKLKASTREFLAKTFGDNHNYAFVAHNDTKSPHVHAVVALRGDDGKKIHTNKTKLHQWRANFVDTAKQHGLNFRAVPRWLDQEPQLRVKRPRKVYSKAPSSWAYPEKDYQRDPQTAQDFYQNASKSLSAHLKQLSGSSASKDISTQVEQHMIQSKVSSFESFAKNLTRSRDIER